MEAAALRRRVRCSALELGAIDEGGPIGTWAATKGKNLPHCAIRSFWGSYNAYSHS